MSIFTQPEKGPRLAPPHTFLEYLRQEAQNEELEEVLKRLEKQPVIKAEILPKLTELLDAQQAINHKVRRIVKSVMQIFLKDEEAHERKLAKLDSPDTKQLLDSYLHLETSFKQFGEGLANALFFAGQHDRAQVLTLEYIQRRYEMLVETFLIGLQLELHQLEHQLYHEDPRVHEFIRHQLELIHRQYHGSPLNQWRQEQAATMQQYLAPEGLLPFARTQHTEFLDIIQMLGSQEVPGPLHLLEVNPGSWWIKPVVAKLRNYELLHRTQLPLPAQFLATHTQYPFVIIRSGWQVNAHYQDPFQSHQLN